MPLYNQDGKLFTLSFSGSVNAAVHVISTLKEKMRNYKRRKVIIQEFQVDLAHWLKEALLKLPLQDANNLQFQ